MILEKISFEMANDLKTKFRLLVKDHYIIFPEIQHFF